MSRTHFDTARLEADLAAKGWQPADLADRAGVARSTVSRFLRGDFQTNRMAKRLAETVGYSVKRYLVVSDEAKAS
jgi:transcriptional regulator with XRE-family HTH domain